MPNRVRIKLLTDQEFWASYSPLCSPIENPPKDVRAQIHAELGVLDEILRSAIAAKWGNTDAYYEFSEDWNVCRHHSMSVCSDTMCCQEFLTIILRGLARMERDWCFHVSLNCTEDMGWGKQNAGFGALFFHAGFVFGNRSNQFNYALFDNQH